MPPTTSAGRGKPDGKPLNNDRNEYIPSFISKKPFYIPEEDSTDYLEHQRLKKKEESSRDEWYDRGAAAQRVQARPARTKWRAGACENCGAMGHKRQDCLEKPRKRGAKLTGKDIRPDDVQLKDLSGLGYEAKRDRWNGYDAETEFQAIHESYERMAELKRQAARARSAEEEQDVDGDKYEEEANMGRGDDAATKGRRNLRIREDTAKYLVNLDLESAKYDPKTRSMVGGDTVLEGAANGGGSVAADDGFVQSKELDGDAAEFARAQHYAWEVEERAKNAPDGGGIGGGASSETAPLERIHLQANPTAGALAFKREAAEREERARKRRQELADKYGDQAAFSMANAPVEAIPESSEYVEYDESGREIARNGQDVRLLEAARPKAKSRYAEDVRVNNHTSVFGSWWHDHRWGYQCCFSTVRNSYCQGELGRKAFLESKAEEGVDAPGTKRAADDDFDGRDRKRLNARED